MKLTQKQLRFIIQEELTLVLETKAARDWIAKQDERQRNRLMDWYEAGMQNIPDLSYALKKFPTTFVLDTDLLEAYYSPKYKDILNRYGITQLKDFEEQGYSFMTFMHALIHYEETKDLDPSDIENSKDAKIIGQVGDWTITDPVSGEESTRCAEGTTWCTKNASTYGSYVKGDIKLYYLSNDQKEYPYNKLSFGVDRSGIRYGGDGEYTVDADNGGIRSYDHARQIIGDDFDEIKSILLDYYPKDMEKRALQNASGEKLFLNFINFAREAKKLTDSSQRILFYKRVLEYVRTEGISNFRAGIAGHLIKIFDLILKDKEVKNKKFLLEEKNKIISIIRGYLSNNTFLSDLPDEEKIKKFNLIYKANMENRSVYVDADGEWVEPEDEGARFERTYFDSLYSDLARLYRGIRLPENIRAELRRLQSKLIDSYEKEMSHMRKELKDIRDEDYRTDSLNLRRSKRSDLKDGLKQGIEDLKFRIQELKEDIW